MKKLLVKILPKSKITLILLIFIIIGVLTWGTLETYDFTQNNPKFCISCHLMKPAYQAWHKSKHAKINCHECHHLSIIDQNRLLISFLLDRPESVPDRHGKVIVSWKLCIKCHWEKDKRYPQAKMIHSSRLHAKHYFMEKIECSKCHGSIEGGKVHEFIPEGRFCVKCHPDKKIHNEGMKKLACLNCHTDRTIDLKPDRSKCLFCHGDASTRKGLITQGGYEIKHYKPSDKVIKKAKKIVIPKNAPMQFYCYKCHKPHSKVRPSYGTCLSCHPQIVNVGQHQSHLQKVGMDCTTCHKPHLWRVSKQQAKTTCVMCHKYKNPMTFIGIVKKQKKRSSK